MNKSESIIEISTALLVFQGKAKKIIKTAENPFFKSSYADLPSILDEIHQPLIDSGLVVCQFPDGDGLTTIVIHAESGEFLEATATMKPIKNDPQSMGSAITYQRRYSLCAILGLNVDKDDDGNAASAPVKTTPPKTSPQPANNLPWLNQGTPEFEKVKAYIHTGGMYEEVLKKYRISKEVKIAIES